MPENLIFTIFGFSLALVLFIVFRRFFFPSRGSGKEVCVYSSIEQLRSVGELVVFKMVTKEIVTASQHWFGEIGEKYFQWLVSTKKMAMIFEFDIDFRYDLRSPDFKIKESGKGKYLFRMPPCFYQVHIRDISFYDEQNSKFLPWLLPDLLNRAFGSGFSETEKNMLKEEAKNQAAKLAEGVVHKLQREVENSASQTILALARNLGVEMANIDFSQSRIIPSTVHTVKLEAKIQQAKEKVTNLIGKE